MNMVLQDSFRKAPLVVNEGVDSKKHIEMNVLIKGLFRLLSIKCSEESFSSVLDENLCHLQNLHHSLAQKESSTRKKRVNDIGVQMSQVIENKTSIQAIPEEEFEALQCRVEQLSFEKKSLEELLLQ